MSFAGSAMVSELLPNSFHSLFLAGYFRLLDQRRRPIERAIRYQDGALL
jgi:hypothetical protein